MSAQTRFSAAACISYESNQSVLHPMPNNIPQYTACTTGLVAASYTPEVLALHYPNHIISANPHQYRDTRIFIGTDSQSTLTALNPLKRPKFGKVDVSPIIKQSLDTSRNLNMEMHFQWVPGHIGIEGNEAANSLANDLRSESTIAMQIRHEIEPASQKPSFGNMKD